MGKQPIACIPESLTWRSPDGQMVAFLGDGRLVVMQGLSWCYLYPQELEDERKDACLGSL